MTRERDQEDEEDRVKECLQEERRKEENGDYSGKEERNQGNKRNEGLLLKAKRDQDQFSQLNHRLKS